MDQIQDVLPPLLKPDAGLEKVLKRAPCPQIQPSRPGRASLPVHALGNLEVVGLTKDWLQNYATLISREEGGLPWKPAEQNIDNKLRKLFEVSRRKRVKLLGFSTGNLRLFFMLSRQKGTSIFLKDFNGSVDQLEDSENGNVCRLSRTSAEQSSYSKSMSSSDCVYCGNVRALYYIPPNKACKERFAGLTFDTILRSSDLEEVQLLGRSPFVLIYDGNRRHLVALSEISKNAKLRDFKPFDGGSNFENGRFKIGGVENGGFDFMFFPNCFENRNHQYQLRVDGVVLLSKLYLLSRFYPVLLDMVFIHVHGVPLTLGEFFNNLSVESLLIFCTSDKEFGSNLAKALPIWTPNSNPRFREINGKRGKELFISVQRDNFAAKRAGALYYLLVALVQENPDLFKDYAKICVVFEEDSSLKRFSMTLRQDI